MSAPDVRAMGPLIVRSSIRCLTGSDTQPALNAPTFAYGREQTGMMPWVKV